MTFNAARQSFAFSAAMSCLLAALFAVRFVVAPYAAEAPFMGGMPPAAAITAFSVQYPWLSVAIALFLLVRILFVVVQLTVRYASATSRNYLPSQFFIMAACGIAVSGEAVSAFMAALLLLFSIRQFISSFRKDYRFEEAFRAGFYLGLIPLLYAPGVLLLLLIPAVMSLYRRSLRELTVCVIGALLPVPGACSIYWVLGESPAFIYRELWRSALESPAIQSPAQIPIVATVAAGVLAVLVITAMVWFLMHRKGMRTRQRKVMWHVSMLFAAMALSLLLSGSSASAAPLMAVLVAMAVPYAFSGRQALVSSILYCVAIAVFLALNLLPILGISVP